MPSRIRFEGVDADRVARRQIVGPVEIDIVDIVAGDELLVVRILSLSGTTAAISSGSNVTYSPWPTS